MTGGLRLLLDLLPFLALAVSLDLEALATLQRNLVSAGRRAGWLRAGSSGFGRKSGRHHATILLQESFERRESVGRIEGEHLEDKSVDLGRYVGPDLAWRNRSALEALSYYRRRVVAFERGDASERVVDRAAEGVHVRPVVDWLLLYLLGGDVIGSSPDFVSVLLHRREAEVDELRVAVCVKKDVLRLYVAVHEPLVGGAPEGLSHLLADLHHARNVNRRARVLHELVERAPRDEFHRDVRHAVGDAVAVDLGDVRMD